MPSAHDVLAADPKSPPWWRFGYVWLVISGPLIVVIAAFLSFGIAFNGQDAVISAQSQSFSDTTEPAPANANPQSWVPAVKGRNHAATPENALPSARH